MFRKGDRIVCINNIGREGLLTNGKIYTVQENEDQTGLSTIWFQNDKGEMMIYYSRCFISLKEYRKQKINKIYDLQ